MIGPRYWAQGICKVVGGKEVCVQETASDPQSCTSGIVYSVLAVIQSRYMSKASDHVKVFVAFFQKASAIGLVSLRCQRKGMSTFTVQ